MEFVTTETELKAIAIEAKTGFNRKPFIGYKTPAANKKTSRLVYLRYTDVL
jgi:hypothetical protein